MSGPRVAEIALLLRSDSPPLPPAGDYSANSPPDRARVLALLRRAAHPAAVADGFVRVHTLHDLQADRLPHHAAWLYEMRADALRRSTATDTHGDGGYRVVGLITAPGALLPLANSDGADAAVDVLRRLGGPFGLLPPAPLCLYRGDAASPALFDALRGPAPVLY